MLFYLFITNCNLFGCCFRFVSFSFPSPIIYINVGKKKLWCGRQDSIAVSALQKRIVLFPSSREQATPPRGVAFKWVRVLILLTNKKRGGFCLLFFYWCGRQDSNLHAHAEEPKSTESTNSTTPACGPILARRKSLVNRNRTRFSPSGK